MKHNGTQFFSKAAWSYFIKLYQGQHRKLLFTSFGSAAQILFVIPTLLLVRYAFDDVIPQKNITLLIIIGIIIFSLRLINSVISVWLRSINIKIINTAIYRLREDLLIRLYNFSRKFHTREDQRIIHARIVQDSERLTNMSTALVSNLMPSLFISFALCVVLIFLNWFLFLIILSLFPILFFVNRYMGKLIKKRVYVFQRAFESFSKGTMFVLRFMDLTLIQSAEKQETERQKDILRDLQHKTGIMALIYAFNNQLQDVLTGFTGILIIILGGVAVINQTMTIGEFLSFYLAAVFLNKYINLITSSFGDIVAGNESLTTLFRLIETKEIRPYQGIRKIDYRGLLQLSSVFFSYNDHFVLKGTDLQIKPGSKIAIIGPNGSGKTTILNLILGLYAPQEGTLFADNIPYEEINIDHFRRSLGVVSQHPLLFSGTIRENITYGIPDIPTDQVIKAAKEALADDFIRKLPDAYDTAIGEDGVLLSGGECQRIALARALVRKPKLLILDEPTNHLDNDAVASIMKSIDNIENRPAIIIISHDMSVVAHADTIYMMDDGILRSYNESNNILSLPDKTI